MSVGGGFSSCRPEELAGSPARLTSTAPGSQSRRPQSGGDRSRTIDLRAGEKGGAMPGNPNVRRMTLRQLLTASEKCARDLAEQLHTTLLSRAADCRDLSRPVRRRSHYPTV